MFKIRILFRMVLSHWKMSSSRKTTTKQRSLVSCWRSTRIPNELRLRLGQDRRDPCICQQSARGLTRVGCGVWSEASQRPNQHRSSSQRLCHQRSSLVTPHPESQETPTCHPSHCRSGHTRLLTATLVTLQEDSRRDGSQRPRHTLCYSIY